MTDGGVDDLFGGGAGAPPPPQDRVRQVYVLTAVGFALTLLGPCCFTGVPGAAVATWAWYRGDEEMARVEAGYLAPDREGVVRSARSLAFAGMALAFVLVSVQLALWAYGFYEWYAGQLAQLLLGETPAP
jgi:hypothetical protein